MFENLFDNVFEHCKCFKECPFNLENLEIPTNFKDMMNAFESEIKFKNKESKSIKPHKRLINLCLLHQPIHRVVYLIILFYLKII